MPIDTKKLRNALDDPLVQAMDDATASAALSVPILTPRAGKVMYSSLASVWGTEAADGFYARLTEAAKAAEPLGAFARSALRVIDGAGFDAPDPQSARVARGFVAAGLATQEQVDGIFFDTSYRCGDVVSVDAVSAARAAIALEAAYVASAQVAVDSYNGVRAWLDAKKAAGETAPSGAEVLAKMGAAQ